VIRWTRIVVGENAEGHKHSFQRDGEEKQVARVEVGKKGKEMEASMTSGLVDLLGAHIVVFF
jgi:urate oxidase